MLPGAAPGLLLAPSARLRAALAEIGLEPADLRLLCAVDGSRDLSGAATAAGLDAAAAAVVVGRLLAAGMVDLVPAPVEPAPERTGLGGASARPTAPSAVALPPEPAAGGPVPFAVALPEAVTPAPVAAPPFAVALPAESAAAPPFAVALPPEPAAPLPAPRAPEVAPVPHVPPPDPETDTAALLRELSLLHVTRPTAPPPAVAPVPTALAPPPGAAATADRRKRGLFGRG